MNQERHYLQLQILRHLLFNPTARFTDLQKKLDIENNKVTFHISQLIKEQLIEKNFKGLYHLTEKGKEFANRMDTDTTQMMKQGKIGVISCCLQDIHKELEYLVYTRAKQPFYGSQGYPSGKVAYGESLYDAAKRELQEETGLLCSEEPVIFLIEHHLVQDVQSEKLLEDKYFYFVLFKNPRGEIRNSEEGSFEWIQQDQLDGYVTKPFESLEKMHEVNNMMQTFQKETPYFREIVHRTDQF